MFLFCRLVGCLVRHLVVASFLSLRGAGWHLVVAGFCLQVKASPAHTSCVGFGISEARMSVFVFWFVLLFGMLLGVWGNISLLFYRSPLNLSRTFLLVVAHEFCFGSHVVGCCVWGGVLCENCIVDANAIKKQQ